MLGNIVATIINNQQINTLPANKADWAEYIAVQCDKSEIDKTETALDHFNRCFPAKFEYFSWLQEKHPREYLRFQAEQGRKVREILRTRY